MENKGIFNVSPLTNFELKMHYENEPRFNGVYSRNNLQKKNNK